MSPERGFKKGSHKKSPVIFLPGVTLDLEPPSSGLKELLAGKEALITATRKYVKDQAGLWRQIPLLALEADFRVGALHQTQVAYTTGYWYFSNGKDPGDKDYKGDTCVDLETGDLLTNMLPQYIGIGKKHYYRELGLQPAPDSEVFRLLEVPQQLSAASIIEALRKISQNPLVDTFDARGITEYKKKQRESYGITPVYARKNPNSQKEE